MKTLHLLVKNLTCGFCGLGSIGILDGAQGKMSRGEPHRNEEVLPSPSQFHTRAVGQRRVAVCTIAQSLSTMDLCWGQSRYSTNTDAKGWLDWYWLLVVDVTVLKKKFVQVYTIISSL